MILGWILTNQRKYFHWIIPLKYLPTHHTGRKTKNGTNQTTNYSKLWTPTAEEKVSTDSVNLTQRTPGAVTLSSLPYHALDPTCLIVNYPPPWVAGLIEIRACSLSCFLAAGLATWCICFCCCCGFGLAFCNLSQQHSHTHTSIPIQWLPKVSQKHCNMQKKIWCWSDVTENKSTQLFIYFCWL